MSAEATGWTYRHSPLKGSGLLVHLAIADSVNDQHYNEFWMTVGRLADKARVERRTAGRALQDLADGGFLTMLEDHSKERKPSRYRFEFPAVAVVFETRASREHGSTEPMTRVEGTQAHGSPRPTNPRGTQEIPSSSRVRDGFNAFWQLYPKRSAKVAALKAYERAVRVADPDIGRAIWKINSAAKTYAEACNPKYYKMPQGWLNDGRWDDEIVTARRPVNDFPEEV